METDSFLSFWQFRRYWCTQAAAPSGTSSLTGKNTEGSMICSNCKSEVSVAKFCSSCGSLLAGQNETRSFDKVDAAWLRDILIGAGYSIEDFKESSDGGSFLARHKDNPNWFVDYRKAIRLVCFSSPWTIRSPSMFQRTDYYAAINKVNQNTVAIQCSVNDAHDCFTVQCSFFVTESVSRLDIIAFNERAVSLVRRGIQDEALKKFH
jgi:hypothetical protein